MNLPSPKATLILHACDVILLSPFVPRNYDQIPLENKRKINTLELPRLTFSTIIQAFNHLSSSFTEDS